MKRGVHGERIQGLQCSAEVKRGLQEYCVGLAEAASDGLVGIYLYGSLAHGCFHPETSDVDVVVVTTRSCSETAISQVLSAHERAGVLVDATFVTRSQIDSDETPAPVDFVVKLSKDEDYNDPIGAPCKMVRLPEGKRDFPLIRQDAYDCDVALAGACAREAVRPVPWEALAECLDYLFPHILPRFKNPALMLCRTVYAFANRKLCSKRTAGEWALGVLDEEWRPLVEEALEKYAAGVPDDRGPNERLRAFEECCARHIADARGESA